MKTQTHLTYIKAQTPEGLHEDCLRTLSDLAFLKDELRFLRDLLTEHSLEFIFGKSFEESRHIAETLSNYEKRGQQLLKVLKEHANKLQLLIDDIEVPNEVSNYKDIHYKLMIEIMDFYTDVKNTKQQIFNTLTKIMKKERQKRLL